MAIKREDLDAGLDLDGIEWHLVQVLQRLPQERHRGARVPQDAGGGHCHEGPYYGATHVAPLPQLLLDQPAPAQFAHVRLGAPERRNQNMPLSTRRSSTRFTPRGLFGNKGRMIDPSKSVKS